DMIYLFLTLLVGLSTWFAWQRSNRNKRVAFLQKKIADRQKEQKESIEWAKKESEKIPETRRRDIAAMDFKQLQASLQSGSISAVETLSTYIGLSLAAHEKTNCLTL
ncbi:hypothetical protein PFISCL1PPCAC_7013, partial [Pristionchus fissidentatus]